MATPNYLLNKRMWDLYVKDTSKFLLAKDGRIWQPKDDGVPRTLKRKNIYSHLTGFCNVAVFASEKATKFICFDIDLDDAGVVRRVIDAIQAVGIGKQYIYPSISGGKGYHVEIFFDSAVANETAEKLYMAVIEQGHLNPRKVEFRPTATLAVRLPLSLHYKTGVRGWYCDVDTLEPIESEDYAFEIKQLARAEVDRILRPVKINKAHSAPVNAEFDAASDVVDISVGDMPVLEKQGERHQLMVKIAVWLRMQSISRESIEDILLEWAAQQDRALIKSTDEEIAADAAEIAEWAALNVKKKYYPNFKLPEVRFTAADLNYILHGKTKLDRRILFRLLLSGKVFGKSQASQRLIAESLGFSLEAVQKRMAWLRRNGLVEQVAGKRYYKNHQPRVAPSTYIPLTEVTEIVDPADVAAEFVLGEKLQWPRCPLYYARMMKEMLGPNMRKYLSVREIANINGELASAAG